MIEHIGLNITEAVEEAAKAIGNDAGIDWDTTDVMMQVQLREMAIVPVREAAPFIVAQVLADIASRTYDID
jgi:hypothetical protein